MTKHFVTFYSPGTFIAEETTKEIDSWNTEKAVQMSKDIIERYDAHPYAFVFTTRENIYSLDSHEIDRSNLYYLGGNILTLEQLKTDNSLDNRTLIRNMECNGYDRVIQTSKGWIWTQPLRDVDVVLNL